jgi:hypothetical protein
MGRRLCPGAEGRIERVERALSQGVQLRGFLWIVEEPVALEDGAQPVADAVGDVIEVNQGWGWRVVEDDRESL